MFKKNLSKAIDKIANEINEMSQDEFAKIIKKHKNEEYAQILTGVTYVLGKIFSTIEEKNKKDVEQHDK